MSRCYISSLGVGTHLAEAYPEYEGSQDKFVFNFTDNCAISCTRTGNTISRCPSHLYCDYKEGYCKTTNGTLCDSSADCGSTQYCFGQLCIDGTKVGVPCTVHADCGKF